MATKARAIPRRKVTDRDLEAMFDVTRMTLYLWRQGTRTRSKLRTCARRTVRAPITYYLDDVLAWAKRHDIAIVKDPRTITSAERKRPGPKPRVGLEVEYVETRGGRRVQQPVRKPA